MQLTKILMAFVIVGFHTISAQGSSWYLAMKGGVPDKCIYWKETLEESLFAVNDKFGNCDVLKGQASYPFGSIFHCGKNNNQFLFRSSDNCELARTVLTRQGKLDPLAFAPPKTKNKAAWVIGIRSCLSRPSRREMLKRAGLQAFDDYCACTAAEFGKKTNAQLANKETMAKLLSDSIEKCQISLIKKDNI